MQIYEANEAKTQALQFFNNDELAAQVFISKYALRDDEGNILEATPVHTYNRVIATLAPHVAKIKGVTLGDATSWLEDRFLNSMGIGSMGRILLQGSPLAALGNTYKLQSSANCWVVGSPHDSYGSILYTDSQLASIYKRRGGVGVDVSNIRPKGMPTNNAAITTDGLSPFLERYSNTTREVAINGRRGALMISLSCHHPEILTFINIKRDKTKVTGANISVRWTEEFMNALNNDEQYELRFPIDPKLPRKFTKMVRAKDIWDAYIEANHESAEPGSLFWDLITSGLSDLYSHLGFETLSTNPCLSFDTKIAVADGRGAVSIGELATEGKDVPVYSLNPDTGKISINWGRNPRITGFQEDLVRVTLDNGDHYDVTPNHKFILRDSSTKEAKDLKPGDSLTRFTKTCAPVNSGGKLYNYVLTDVNNPDVKVAEHRMISQFYDSESWSALDDAVQNDCIRTGGIVVHHINDDSQDNRPENLEVMLAQEHATYHIKQLDTKGEGNGRFSGYSHEDIKSHALILTTELNRRFSRDDWEAYAKPLGLPLTFSSFRKDAGLSSVTDLATWAAETLGLQHISKDPRLVKTYQSMVAQGYMARITDDGCEVKKTCEHCSSDFWTSHLLAGSRFCGSECGNAYLNSNTEISVRRTESRNKRAEEDGAKLKTEQARIFSKLTFDLGRRPMLKEWEQACKKEGFAFRLKTKYGFASFADLIEAGEAYNHKVVSVIPLPGKHRVYNITVDNDHTYFVVNNKTRHVDGRDYVTLSGVSTRNCGEIPLSEADSCRLGLVDVTKFVTDPFTSKASVNWKAMEQAFYDLQIIMDAVIDAELEILHKIVEKVESDPEPSHTKIPELNFWRKAIEVATNGRRTGSGLTGLADMLAMANIGYATSQGVSFTDSVYRCMAVGTMKASIDMAKDHGSFPIWDGSLEKDHKQLNLILDACGESYKDQHWLTGRRNISLTTTAPVGSLSILSQTTSGIEPPYMLSYGRKRKLSDSQIAEGAKVSFVDALGDRWAEYTVYHHHLKTYMDITGGTIEDSPYFGNTSVDTDWEISVDIQATAQKWVTHSISKTCNLPNSASKELVDKVYRRAWEKGCKGFTVYRDGCRDGVLTSTEGSKIELKFPLVDAAPRPTTLECDIHIAGQHVYVVGLMDERPYEVFALLDAARLIPVENPTRATLVKRKKRNKNYYDLVVGEVTYPDIASYSEDSDFAVTTRLISLALRHGAAVNYIVDQILKDKTHDMFSVLKKLGSILKSYVQDGIVSTVKAQDFSGDSGCPSAPEGEPCTLVYQEGCLTCTTCGMSKCG